MGNTDINEKGKITVRVDADLADIIPTFLENRHGDVGSILEALDRGDYETIRILGHSLKGAGGGYGFQEITQIGQSLERAAIEENPAEIRSLVAELSSYLERTEVVYE